MIHGALDYIADNENDLIAALEEYRQARRDGREPFQIREVSNGGHKLLHGDD
jgi:hypothetical protein